MTRYLLLAMLALSGCSADAGSNAVVAQSCAAGQAPNQQGQCAPDPCNGFGTFSYTHKECEITEGGRYFFAIQPGLVKTSVDNACPSGYLPHPGLTGYCSTPDIIATWQQNQHPGQLHLDPQQAADFNARQQAKRDMEDAMDSALRAHERREAISGN